jgi:hypothetical protein
MAEDVIYGRKTGPPNKKEPERSPTPPFGKRSGCPPKLFDDVELDLGDAFSD